jgi:uncharacterized membrane protein
MNTFALMLLLFLSGMIVYQLISWKTIYRNFRVSAKREEQPRKYWPEITIQFLGLTAIAFLWIRALTKQQSFPYAAN